jgi:sarcosine oxidase
MLAEAVRHGATLAFDEPILDWTARSDDVEVRTAFGRHRAHRLILAAGAWMASDLPRTALPLTVARQTMFWLRPSDLSGVFSPARCPVWLWETRAGPVYYGFPDLGDGPKVARHHGGAVTTPEGVRREVAADEAEHLLAFLAASIPGLHGQVTDARVCLYTNTPDEHFVLDRHPEHRHVLLASPCSGHGFKFAPAIGEALADLAMDRAPRYDLGPFRVGRFE